VFHARLARRRLHGLLRQFPIVAILGPRQIGKSTLARSALGGFTFFDLEDAADLDRVRADPAFVLQEHPRIVFDEVQRLPEIFPLLRVHVDRTPRSRVVLLGSAAPSTLTRVSESLSGRVGFLELGPISLLEESRADLWVRGAFPRVHWSRPRARPEEWFPAYLRTCLEQDLPELGFRLSSVRLRTLLMMLAQAQGGICNLSELGGALGLTYHAVAHLLDVLEGVYLVRRLRPWFANVGKRLVKSPKVYVRDTGLLHSLLGIPFSRQAILAHPKAGASFETFCIEQIVALARLVDPSAEPYFWRTHGGVEVDLVLSLRGRLVPIEVKLGISPPDTRPLETAMKDLGLDRGFVVNAGKSSAEIRRGIVMCGLRGLFRALRLDRGPAA